jgi:hypothetical protein
MNLPTNFSDMSALEQLIWLRKQQAELRQLEDAIKPIALVEYMKTNEPQEVFGETVIVAYRSTWAYSDRCMALQEQLRETQRQEQQSGRATATVAPYITIKSQRV